MANLAAIIPKAKAPLELFASDIGKLGPNELLVRNEVFALNPVEFKIAKLGILPLQYPAIIGSTFAGTIEAIGEELDSYTIGDRVVVSKRFGIVDNRYGAYQRYVIVADTMVSKMPDTIDLAVPVSLMMNLTCVVGLFTGRLGLDKPSFDVAPQNQHKRILIYGGSSSFGSLSVQYLSQAGYTVITTSSPSNHKFVEKLGPAKIHDHTLEAATLVHQLIASGPYDVCVDMISLPTTLTLNARVLAMQGGGKLYCMQPGLEPERLPKNVEILFEPWSESLYENPNRELKQWVCDTYMPEGLSRKKIIPLPVEKVSGGLNGVDDALSRMQHGISGVRLVVDPWHG